MIGCLRQLPLEPLERAEELVDRLGQLALRLVAALGGEVLPEQRVEHVAREVERELLLEPGDRLEVVAGRARRRAARARCSLPRRRPRGACRGGARASPPSSRARARRSRSRGRAVCRASSASRARVSCNAAVPIVRWGQTAGAVFRFHAGWLREPSSRDPGAEQREPGARTGLLRRRARGRRLSTAGS